MSSDAAQPDHGYGFIDERFPEASPESDSEWNIRTAKSGFSKLVKAAMERPQYVSNDRDGSEVVVMSRARYRNMKEKVESNEDLLAVLRKNPVGAEDFKPQPRQKSRPTFKW